MNSPLIASKVLWDDLGNRAEMSLHGIGPDRFELYLSAYSSVPTRHLGTLGECNNVADVWLAHKKDQGFKEQLPSCLPEGGQV